MTAHRISSQKNSSLKRRVRTLHVRLVHVEVAAEQVACLGVPLCDRAVLVARDDVLGEVGEAGNGGLALVADYPRDVLVALGGVDVGVDLVDNDGGQVPGALLGDTQQLAAVGRELDALDGGGELPCLQQPAGLDLPQAHRVVGAAGRDHLGGGVDVDGPQGTDVAVVCAQTLAIVRIYVLSAGGARSAVGGATDTMRTQHGPWRRKRSGRRRGCI